MIASPLEIEFVARAPAVSNSRSPMAKLTFVLEDGQEIVVPLAEHITLGREDDNDVVIDDDRVSKHHAELVRNADGSIQLFDSNSTSGTFVNGQRVRSHTILHGDQLAFGPLTAVLDLEENGTNGSTLPLAATGSDTQPLTSGSPVKADRIGTRKKNRNGRRAVPDNHQITLPSEELPARQQSEKRETARLEMEKARLQAELDAMQKTLRDWRQQSESERAMHHARVETLRAEETRLAPIKAAVAEAEAAHAEWLKSVQSISTQHEEKSAALQRITAELAQKSADLQRFANDEAAARHELAGLAAHRDQALAHLQQLRAETVHDETALDALRRQMSDLEARSLHIKEVTDVREDQLKTAEKKLEQLSQHRTQLEARAHELTGTEEKLAQTIALCREAEAKHTTLTAAIATLSADQQRSETTVKDLTSRIATLNESHQRDTAATAEALASRQRAEAALRRLQDEIATCEKNLATETQRLQEATTRRAELDRQCQELAGTAQKLADVKQQLAEAQTSIASSQTQIAEQKSATKALAADEIATKGRIEVLHARENDLRAELTQLSAAERSHRTRFEEVRQLATEAEKEHAAQQQQLASSLEATRSELLDLVSRLTPLRDWKEAMDLLYARLATLPQDSEEARHLWHEIEKEKAGLHELITIARTQAQAAIPAASHDHALSQIIAANPRPPRAGAAATATSQETTLRSRLGHLRESVQREESRLEQLRLERTRYETPHRASPAADAMMREQSRHLETKIRQEQERHHALLRHIELAQAEEDKRRERLNELEHKLAELRTDITEAERLRSELRQQADLAHTELKNYEAAIDRAAKKTAE